MLHKFLFAVFFIFLCLITEAKTIFLKNKTGIVVFKLMVCNKSNDEYCIVEQDIYFNSRRHTIAEYKLINDINSQIPTVNATYKQAVQLQKICETRSCFHNLASSTYFAREILASEENWVRGTGGELFILNQQSNYNISPLFIVYEVTGDFLFMSLTKKDINRLFYDKKNQKIFYKNLHLPIVTVMNIHSFHKISDRCCRKLGLRHYDLPYYRIRTSDEPSFFDQNGRGELDN
jgi:hypothetical protein